MCGVLLTATRGRAFCAGGDIRQVASDVTSGPEFLRKEYSLILALHEIRQEKPLVSLADGIIFGADGGLFIAAGTRIVTVDSSFSMPEIALGIIPDCGATDWLSGDYMPRYLGQWAALTGARLASPMMGATGLATHMVLGGDKDQTRASVQELRARLVACPDASAVATALHHEEVTCRAVAERVGAVTFTALEHAANRAFGPGLDGLDERLMAMENVAKAAADETLNGVGE